MFLDPPENPLPQKKIANHNKLLPPRNRTSRLRNIFHRNQPGEINRLREQGSRTVRKFRFSEEGSGWKSGGKAPWVASSPPLHSRGQQGQFHQFTQKLYL
ncbi:hypothetical protein WN51_04233 [Melipona quadrifasciata]|uniref:Uncharacterized protein n=1 Tax=Melipona quadrifasciata TaxID=166423 RepID=A0A0M8ZWV2_9HYME|nr:hypothetical protein WN51_04233 [Melipona quadrifasciata]